MNGKRKCASIKSPLACLEHLSSILPSFEYGCIQDYIFDFDTKKQIVQQQQKKSLSDGMLYSRCCCVIFTELQDMLYEHYEYMLRFDSLYRISRIVECEIGRRRIEDQEAIQGAMVCMLMQKSLCLRDSKTDLEDGKSWKTGNHASIEKMKKMVEVIRENTASQLLVAKHEILSSNTHLRFSLAYNKIDRIVALGFEECENTAQEDHFLLGKSTKNVDDMIDDGVQECNVYRKVKNEILLGAVLRYTKNVREGYEAIRANMIVSGVHVKRVKDLNRLENELIKRIAIMREKTQDTNTQSDKIQAAIHAVQIEMSILQEEVGRVAKVANNMRAKIQYGLISP